MIGLLPKTLTIDDKKHPIRSDYRVALTIFLAYNDVELSDTEKTQVMLECLYEDVESIDNLEEAINQAVWFLDGGTENPKTNDKKVLDWEQDQHIIFPAINKVAGYETRGIEYIHWWTFLGFFNGIEEGLFSTIVNIRSKKNKGKKLEKHEEEFYRENKHLIDIKVKLSEEEIREKEYFEQLLGE